MNEHKGKKKEYEVGQEVMAKILDIDKERRLLDLSHSKHFVEHASKNPSQLQLANCQHTKTLIDSFADILTKFPKKKSLKARVELIKESYAVVSFAKFDYVLALVPIRLFNQDEKEAQLNKLSIGHILNVKICGYSEQQCVFLGVPDVINLRKIWDTEHSEILLEDSQRKLSNADVTAESLEVGKQINGRITNVQGLIAFVHVNKKM